MSDYRSKIKKLSDAKKEIDKAKACGKKIVFTNGCFDILHSGHARYLYSAREQGDYLIVAVNSDESVRSIKGKGRPVNHQDDRAEVVAALESVDLVIIFDQDTPFEVIQDLMPDILVKGGDWEKDKIVGGDIVENSGGKVIRIPYLSGYSTTSIIDKIIGFKT